jgi:hypothetical protein
MTKFGDAVGRVAVPTDTTARESMGPFSSWTASQ